MKRIISTILIIALLLSLLTVIPGCSKKSGVKSGIMIYEAYTSGGYYNGETAAVYANNYVVLYNPTKEPISLDGWVLLSCSGSDAKVFFERSANLSGTVRPEAFFVIKGGQTQDISEKRPSGEPLPFDIDLNADTFSPERKDGIIAVCSENKYHNPKPSDSAVEDYLAYGKKNAVYYKGVTPASNPGIKTVLRRTSFTPFEDNGLDYETVNIANTPANIVRYTKKTTADMLSGSENSVNASVTLSHTAGYYDKEFNLTLSTDLPDAKIYYTTDGTAPVTPLGAVSATAKEYTSPIRIYDRTKEKGVLMSIPGTTDDENGDPRQDLPWPLARKDGESQSAYQNRLDQFFTSIYKINIIRTAAVNTDKKIVTPTAAASYFVSAKALSSRYNMPLISIFAYACDLIDNETGIFMPKNRETRGKEARVPSVVQFFEKDGKLAFSETAGFRINGGFTRIYPQKAFRLNMSNSDFDYDLYGGRVKNENSKTVTYFDRFILRSGGNDWGWGGLRDPFWQRYCGKLGTFGVQETRPAAVFLNGEYWGTYHITERQDRHYINSRFGVPLEDVAMMECFFARLYGTGDDEKEIHDLVKFINNSDMTKSENYRRFTNIMDEDSYIDLFITEIFCGNTDWPHNNMRLWKNNNPNATEYKKWKMLMNDIDWGFKLGIGDDHLARLLNTESSDQYCVYMFKQLMTNSEFKNKFITRFEYLLDTFFKTEEILKCLTEIINEVSAAEAEHTHRWGLNKGGYNQTYEDIKTALPQRIAVMRQALDKIR